MTLADSRAYFRLVDPGVTPSDVQMPEASSQSFSARDFLLATTGGQVQLAVAAGSNLDSTGVARGIVGLADEDATGTANTSISCKLDRGAVYAMPVYHSTPASALTAHNLVGTAGYVLRNDSSGGWMVNIGVTTNPILRIVGIDTAQFAVGEQYGIVFVQFLSTVRLGI